MGVLDDDGLEALLAPLHARSEAETQATMDYFLPRFRAGEQIAFDTGAARAFLADKMVALDRDKAEFCHQVCRALGARRVVEAGTSYGISTLYLAAAVRANGGGTVIGTEYEPDKAKAARANFTAAGLAAFIELREGDLRDTLQEVAAPVDFMLIDIWIPMARPALELVLPRLRPGAVVVCDNTASFRDDYADYFRLIAESGKLTTMTLPFAGGLEFTVRV